MPGLSKRSKDMDDKEIHLGLGITDAIYAGKVRTLKSGAMVWSGKKSDVTEEFYNIIIQMLADCPHGAFEFKTTSGHTVTVIMDKDRKDTKYDPWHYVEQGDMPKKLDDKQTFLLATTDYPYLIVVSFEKDEEITFNKSVYAWQEIFVHPFVPARIPEEA